MPLAEADKVALACPPKWPSAAAALATTSPAPTGLAESQLAKKGSGTAGAGRRAPAAALKAKMAESAAAAAAAAKQRQMDKTISQKVSFFYMISPPAMTYVICDRSTALPTLSLACIIYNYFACANLADLLTVLR